MHLKIQDGVQDGYQNDQFCSNLKYFTICYKNGAEPEW